MNKPGIMNKPGNKANAEHARMPTDSHHAASLHNALATSRTCAGARHRLKNPSQTGKVECWQFSQGGLLVDRSCSFTVLPSTSVGMVSKAGTQARRYCGTIHFPTDHTQWADSAHCINTDPFTRFFICQPKICPTPGKLHV